MKNAIFILAYTDNKIEDITQRSLLYITDAALNHPEFNTSRGMVMAQLLNFMGNFLFDPIYRVVPNFVYHGVQKIRKGEGKGQN
jgi:hypothetical protein